MIRIGNIDVTNDPSLSVRNKKREELNFSPNNQEDDFTATVAKRSSLLKFNLDPNPPKPKPPKTIV